MCYLREKENRYQLPSEKSFEVAESYELRSCIIAPLKPSRRKRNKIDPASHKMQRMRKDTMSHNWKIGVVDYDEHSQIANKPVGAFSKHGSSELEKWILSFPAQSKQNRNQLRTLLYV